MTMHSEGPPAFRRRTLAGLVAGLALAFGAEHAAAEWMRIPKSDVTVWSEIGALQSVRLLQVQVSASQSLYLVVDCVEGKIASLGSRSGPDDELVKDEWENYPPQSHAGIAAAHACAQQVTESADDAWTNGQGKRIGVVGAFRLTQVRPFGDLGEIWVIHCARRLIKPVSTVPSGGKLTLLEANWRSINGVRDYSFVEGACKKRE